MGLVSVSVACCAPATQFFNSNSTVPATTGQLTTSDCTTSAVVEYAAPKLF